MKSAKVRLFLEAGRRSPVVFDASEDPLDEVVVLVTSYVVFLLSRACRIGFRHATLSVALVGGWHRCRNLCLRALASPCQASFLQQA